MSLTACYFLGIFHTLAFGGGLVFGHFRGSWLHRLGISLPSWFFVNLDALAIVFAVTAIYAQRSEVSVTIWRTVTAS